MGETRPSRPVLGIDIGGTGVKGAPVDLTTGELVADRVKIKTPKPATPDAVADVVEEIAGRFADSIGDSPIGIAIPAVCQRGVARSAANIDPAWVDTDVDALFTERLGRPVHVVNDADAAGVAEGRYGVARDVQGLVILTTLGTGIGSAFLLDGKLMPNSELGHLEIDGHDVEAVDRAYAEAVATTGKPTAIVARTRKGAGIEWVENTNGAHGKPVENSDEAIRELGGRTQIRVTPPAPEGASAVRPRAE